MINTVIFDLQKTKNTLEYYQNFYGKNEHIENSIKNIDHCVKNLSKELESQETSFKLIQHFSEELKEFKKTNKDLKREVESLKIMLRRYNPKLVNMEVD